MTLADLISRDGRTPAELAATSDGVVSAERWEAMATRPLLNEDGTPWRPNPGLVTAIASTLGVPEAAVRSAIVTSAPALD